MKALVLAAAGALIASTAALAQQPTSQGSVMTSIPANSRTVDVSPNFHPALSRVSG